MTLQTKKWRKQSKDDTSRKRRKKGMKTLQTLRIIGKGLITKRQMPAKSRTNFRIQHITAVQVDAFAIVLIVL